MKKKIVFYAVFVTLFSNGEFLNFYNINFYVKI